MLVRMNGIIAWIAPNTLEDTTKKLDQNLVGIDELEPILVEKIILTGYDFT
jgi:hypothetical protein